MNDAMIASLKSYWERLRAGRIAPYRAEIDPREFESSLENMFIIERIAPENLRFRLAGMKICEMIGMEVRGMQPGVLVSDAERVRFDRLLGVVMSEPAVVEATLAVSGPVPCRANMLLMPLRNDFGEINRVLGCISLGSPFYQTPLSFTLGEISINPIHSREAAEVRREALPGFAEDVAGFDHAAGGPRLRAIEGNPDAAPAAKRGKPKLRVVD
jgi:hypothetical protein